MDPKIGREMLNELLTDYLNKKIASNAEISSSFKDEPGNLIMEFSLKYVHGNYHIFVIKVGEGGKEFKIYSYFSDSFPWLTEYLAELFSFLGFKEKRV